jgi:hypothetical protein
MQQRDHPARREDPAAHPRELRYSSSKEQILASAVRDISLPPIGGVSVLRHETVTLNRSRSTSLRLVANKECGILLLAEVFSMPAIAKPQRHDVARARIAVIPT